MERVERLRRRYTVLLGVSLVFLAGAIVLFFRVDAGLTRWLVLLVWASITLVWWELRRALPPASEADQPSKRAT